MGAAGHLEDLKGRQDEAVGVFEEDKEVGMDEEGEGVNVDRVR